MPHLLNTWLTAATACLIMLFTSVATAAPLLDATPRVAIVSAFEPELALLLGKVQQPASYQVNGVTFTTGNLQGKPVVLFLSGISMVNAAMNTQLVLDRFTVSHILFSGIAGGANPALNIGDVAVVERWGQYLEVLMARETTPGVFHPTKTDLDPTLGHFGMMYPRSVRVRSSEHTEFKRKFWFDVDPELLAVAKSLNHVSLTACDAQRQCLDQRPQLVVGGNGVSGQAFVDNAAYREYAYKTFDANVLDMESAACAMVAYSNSVPFIAFRSLSDLAGGGAGDNEMYTFMNIASTNSARVLLAFLAAWD
ncbi:MAG: 5'-methylthioadenosine/S-adenosylhomocysteine nucleosidase [Burkholderiaceae bacterium]|nr:5'-methylthioadenosine/S-adenosylhomocysteine nucleosidase [Burkholderiaceae bacterium]